jgi:heme-degrading monooxygenase HmoA
MKQQYRIRNWSEYNASLKQRGSLTFWVSEEVFEQWLETEKTGQRGASRTYSIEPLKRWQPSKPFIDGPDDKLKALLNQSSN